MHAMVQSVSGQHELLIAERVRGIFFFSHVTAKLKCPLLPSSSMLWGNGFALGGRLADVHFSPRAASCWLAFPDTC